ncbi:hypothetical protein SAMN05443572_11955 [Myxococcus fulvus]|uniref:Uncharacterized protein n=1 Tax=Myxococcus fulvus TaxID=33 RepID=A0A511TJ04_MYXFU|nr:hypothetical protein [Myxococcus fulvus]GEN13198.1 hypothetical protein MFU01_82350 [Myxococcus fulvus]SEU42432.1 hypothetical protein SAMN05443572_11955 [Myxococcus fulvus]
MIPGMTGVQLGIFASVFGVGLGVAILLGYIRWRHWNQQLQSWEGFAKTRGWSFMARSGFMYSAGTMEMKGRHAGRSITVETEHRGHGKHFNIFTIVRHGLGNGFPREVTIRPETLGDTVLRLFGNKDEDVGDASLDNALDLRNVTPKARAFLLRAEMRQPLLNLARAFEHFAIQDGVLTVEVIAVPRTTVELYELLKPVRELSDAVRDTSGDTD